MTTIYNQQSHSVQPQNVCKKLSRYSLYAQKQNLIRMNQRLDVQNKSTYDASSHDETVDKLWAEIFIDPHTSSHFFSASWSRSQVTWFGSRVTWLWRSPDQTARMLCASPSPGNCALRDCSCHPMYMYVAYWRRVPPALALIWVLRRPTCVLNLR